MTKKERITLALNILGNTYKDTNTALEFNSPFQLLVATLLAAQSTDVRVNIVTKPFFERYPDARSMATLSVEEISEWIKTVGLYKTKAKNLAATCKIISEKYNNRIPETREGLEGLPGVGRKTANVVMSIALDIPAIAVDTHVFRLSNRIGLAKANNVLDTEKQLMKNIPVEQWSAAHHWLIWHGRKVCKARKPLCPACTISKYCIFPEKTV